MRPRWAVLVHEQTEHIRRMHLGKRLPAMILGCNAGLAPMAALRWNMVEAILRSEASIALDWPEVDDVISCGSALVFIRHTKGQLADGAHNIER
jgi:hypothetical protein